MGITFIIHVPTCTPNVLSEVPGMSKRKGKSMIVATWQRG
jgi:hypothetical protein